MPRDISTQDEIIDKLSDNKYILVDDYCGDRIFHLCLKDGLENTVKQICDGEEITDHDIDIMTPDHTGDNVNHIDKNCAYMISDEFCCECWQIIDKYGYGYRLEVVGNQVVRVRFLDE
jgi:hypothetical protein